ncbi:hypothetical protein BG000_008833 [Podila horticola]|nr:hypothetical protein BG000_008833 [Podila horticola]
MTELWHLSAALKNNSTLVSLNLQDNLIGVHGGMALSEALKTNTTLFSLELAGNKIRENRALALSEVLKTNSTLTTLNLKSNQFGDNGGQMLAEALKTNSTLTTLNLRHNQIRARLQDLSVDERWKIVEGLQAVHDAGVLHNDISQGSILERHCHDGRREFRFVDFAFAEKTTDKAELDAEMDQLKKLLDLKKYNTDDLFLIHPLQ